MSKKKRHKQAAGGGSQPPEPDATPLAMDLRVGDYVRVRPGVRDPDFEDSEIGGWTGRVESILDGKKRSPKTPCIIEWDRRTRRSISPEFKARCEEEGMECTSMGLSLAEIERIVPPEAPEPDSLQDLLERMKMEGEWPDPEILAAILDKGEDAIEPLRELVRYGGSNPDDAPCPGVAAGLLGESQAQAAIPDLLQLLRQGHEDALDWTVRSYVLGVRPTQPPGPAPGLDRRPANAPASDDLRASQLADAGWRTYTKRPRCQRDLGKAASALRA